MFEGPVKLIDRLVRDAGGNPTGTLRTRPTYDVMITPGEYESQAVNGINPLASYVIAPTYLDDCWAGFGTYNPRETTVFLRFSTELECKTKLAKWVQ